jgi:hypothetical protein
MWPNKRTKTGDATNKCGGLDKAKTWPNKRTKTRDATNKYGGLDKAKMWPKYIV